MKEIGPDRDVMLATHDNATGNWKVERGNMQGTAGTNAAPPESRHAITARAMIVTAQKPPKDMDIEHDFTRRLDAVHGIAFEKGRADMYRDQRDTIVCGFLAMAQAMSFAPTEPVTVEGPTIHAIISALGEAGYTTRQRNNPPDRRAM